MARNFVFTTIICFLLSQTTSPEEKKNWKPPTHIKMKTALPNENFAWSFATGPELPLIHDHQFGGIPTPELYLWDHTQHRPKHQQGTRYSVKTKISLSEVEQDDPEINRGEEDNDDDDNDSKEEEVVEEQIQITTPKKLIDNYAEYESPRHQSQNQSTGKIPERKPKNKTRIRVNKLSTKPISNTNQQLPLPIIQLSTQLQPTKNQTTPLMKIQPALLPRTDYEYIIDHKPNLSPIPVYTKSITSTTTTTVASIKKRGRPRVQILPAFTEIFTPTTTTKRKQNLKRTTTTTTIKPIKIQSSSSSNEEDTEFLTSEEIDLNPMSAPEGDFGARIKNK